VQLNAVLLYNIWRNVETSCHKHFVLISRQQQTPPLTTSDKCHNLWRPVDNTWLVAALTAHSEARYRLGIAISAYPIWIRRLHQGSSCWNIAMPFGTEKLEWLGYPMVKNFEDIFIR